MREEEEEGVLMLERREEEKLQRICNLQGRRRHCPSFSRVH